jgi:hypothetical protein
VRLPDGHPPSSAADCGPPPELLVFDPDEWPAEQWWQSLELWTAARREFVKQHPGSALGNMLTVLRENRRLSDAHRRLEWEAGLGGYAS